MTGVRGLRLEPLEQRWLLSGGPLVVTNTQDDGPGSLRAALETANTADYAATIEFQIPITDPQFVDVDSHLLGTDPRADADPDAYVIRPLTPLPALQNHNQGITLDGGSQALFGGDTNPFGPEIVLDGGRAGPSADGLRLESDGNRVQRVNVQTFSGQGLLVTGDHNVIAGSYIGTDATGTADAGNGGAIAVRMASHNVIGGTTAGDGNVISGNGQGMTVWHASSTGNRIQGNRIGTDATGRLALGNDGTGVWISESSGNLVGGVEAAAGNVISGNWQGIGIVGSQAAGNQILGNYIGTDAAGVSKLGNRSGGIQIISASDTVIGGTALGAGNVISGNGSAGIQISGSEVNVYHWPLDQGGSGHWYAVAPYRSWDAAEALAQALGGHLAAIGSQGENDFLAATLAERYSNAAFWLGLSDQSQEGQFRWLTGESLEYTNWADGEPGGGPAENYVAWNLGSIAGASWKWSDQAGTLQLLGLIELDQAADSADLVEVLGSGRTIVQGNYVGVDSSGTLAFGNSGAGIEITNAMGNQIGGTLPGAGNVISGNVLEGIRMWGPSARGNRLEGNRLGTDSTGAAALGNLVGIAIRDAPGNSVGGSSAAARNLVSGNNVGVTIEGPAAVDNRILGNYLGTDASGQKLLGAQSVGVALRDGAARNIIGGTEAGAGNVVSGQLGDGIEIRGQEVSVFHWSEAEGGNGHYYVVAPPGPFATTAAAARSLGGYPGTIANAAEQAFAAELLGMQHNQYSQFWIGLSDLGHEGQFTWGTGESLDFTLWRTGEPNGGMTESHVTMDGSIRDPAERWKWRDTAGHLWNPGLIELDAAPDPAGLRRLFSTTGNVVQGNLIGVDATGAQAVGNGGAGIHVIAAADNQIGGTDPAAWNIISANRGGIILERWAAVGNRIEGNYIGTDVSGAAALGNDCYGVVLGDGARGNMLGGTAASAGNLISGNFGAGVDMAGQDFPVYHWPVGQGGNGHYYVIASLRSWSAAADAALALGGHLATITSSDEQQFLAETITYCYARAGFWIGATDRTQEGQFQWVTGEPWDYQNWHAGEPSGGLVENHVAMNLFAAEPGGAWTWSEEPASRWLTALIELAAPPSPETLQAVLGTRDNLVYGNLIGSDIAGTAALGNAGAGVRIGNAAYSAIGGVAPGQANRIAFNELAGVLVDGDYALHNPLQGNSIHGNGGLGIDLQDNGVTLNDALDADVGPNDLQNFPVLESVTSGNSPRIVGRLDSLANQDFTIDFYAGAGADPSGYGEGQRYLGSRAVTTDAQGNAGFDVTLTGAAVVDGEWVTATATSAATGDTSEISAALPVAPGTLIVTRFVPTRAGFVAQFSRDLEPSVLNLYDSAAQMLGLADVTVTGSTAGPVRGSLVLSPDRRQLTFVRTGGLLEPDTYTVTLFSGVTRFREPAGETLDGNADGTAGDDYRTTFTVAARPVGTVTVSLPDIARGAGQSVNVLNTVAGLPIRVDNAAGVISLAADLVYDPALLAITAATLAAEIPNDWSVALDTVTPGLAKITASGTTVLSGSNLDVVRLTAAVPNGTAYGAVQAIRLENVSLNGGTIVAVGDVAVHKAVYLGDADGSGIHSSADAFLTVQAALGLASGFAAHPWTDPRIVGDCDGSGVLSAADAFLIVQEGLGLSEPFVPNNPHITVTPVGGGVDPQFQIGVNVPASVGGLVTVPVKLAIEEAATNLGGFDFDLFFDAEQLTIQVPGGVLAGADTAGWAVSASLVAPGQLRVGMMSSDGQPLAVGLREIAQLQFEVEGGKSCRTGWQPVPDGLATRPTLLRPIADHRLPITDVWDGSETHPTLLDIEPADRQAGGYTWTAVDGSVAIAANTSPRTPEASVGRLGAAAAGEPSSQQVRDRYFGDLATEILPLAALLNDLAGDVANAWR